MNGQKVLFLARGGSLHQLILNYRPIAYWPLTESAGIVAANYGSLGAAANGTYSGATLAQVPAPGGNGLAPLFDGVNDFVDVYSAALAGGFSLALGSAAILWRVSGVADYLGTLRRAFSIELGSSNNRFVILKSATPNTFTTLYTANGTAEQYDLTTTSVGWNLSVLTWSVAADHVIHYCNSGTALDTDTGLGVPAGALNAAMTIIGGQSTAGGNPWKGYLSRAMLFNYELTPYQIQALYNASRRGI